MQVIEMSAPLITDHLYYDESLSFSGSYMLQANDETLFSSGFDEFCRRGNEVTKAEMSLGSSHDKVSIF